MTAYVGMDLHRRRSVVVCLDEGGERLWWRRIENSPQTLMEVVAEAGPAPEVGAISGGAYEEFFSPTNCQSRARVCLLLWV